MQVTAIIPLKALAEAKGRLSPALDADHRRSLVAWMACRVLAAVDACDVIDDVLVVAGDDAAAEIARAAGARAIVVPEPGLDPALAAADRATAGADATLVLAADLPEVMPADIAVVVAAADDLPTGVVIAPTRDGGTGALLRKPAGVITTAYGPGSAAAHEQLANAVGVAVRRIHRPGLANDVDTPSELPAALALAADLDVGCRPRT